MALSLVDRGEGLARSRRSAADAQLSETVAMRRCCNAASGTRSSLVGDAATARSARVKLVGAESRALACEDRPQLSDDVRNPRDSKQVNSRFASCAPSALHDVERPAQPPAPYNMAAQAAGIDESASRDSPRVADLANQARPRSMTANSVSGPPSACL